VVSISGCRIVFVGTLHRGAIMSLSCWVVVAIGRVWERCGWGGPVGRLSPLMPFVGGVLSWSHLS
jgi:hypothetical protein